MMAATSDTRPIHYTQACEPERISEAQTDIKSGTELGIPDDHA